MAKDLLCPFCGVVNDKIYPTIDFQRNTIYKFKCIRCLCEVVVIDKSLSNVRRLEEFGEGNLS